MAKANNSTHKQNSEDNILTTTIRLKIAAMWPLSWFQGMFEGWAVSDMLTFFFLKKVSRKNFLSQNQLEKLEAARSAYLWLPFLPYLSLPFLAFPALPYALPLLTKPYLSSLSLT